MKTKMKLAHLLTLFFMVSLTFNLFAQEKSKKEAKIVYQTKNKKDGKMMKLDLKKDKNLVWVVKNDDFEWDTTFKFEDDEDIDVNVFLKNRFTGLDSMKNNRIEVWMQGDAKNLRLTSGEHLHKLIELTNGISIDGNTKIFAMNIEELDSMITGDKMLETFVVTGDLKSKLSVLSESLDSLKYKIITEISENNLEKTIELEVLKNVKENMGGFTFVVTDGDDVKIKNVSKIHSDKFHFGLVIDDEIEQEDLVFLKKSGVKIGDERLDLAKLFLYNNDDDFLNLKFKLKTEGKTTIKIIDDKGDAIFIDKVQYFPGTYDKQTKLSMEAEGLYYITIEQNGKSNAYKVKLN